MANEKRLIDANATIVAFTNWLTSRYDGRLPRDIVAEIPTVYAVEVVRCKDCQKWYRHTEVDWERGDCRRYQTTKHETGFCDRGERRTDG